MFLLKDVAWYTICTLRDSCLERHLSELRKFYPQIKVYVIDNNVGKFNISPICEKYNATIIVNKEILPLTVNQIEFSKEAFKSHKVLAYSADDISILEGGFIQKALFEINSGAEICSFSTDQDPVAYCYTPKFFEEVGFNKQLLGKECTDTDLIKSTYRKYKKFHHVGEYWRYNGLGWTSRYVMNPDVGKLGKTEVNQDLELININSGRDSNNKNIR